MESSENIRTKLNDLKTKAAEAAQEPYYDPHEEINGIVDMIVSKVKGGMSLEDAVSPYRTAGDRVEGFAGGIITRLQGLGYDIELNPNLQKKK